MAANSKPRRRRRKGDSPPKKPYSDFPLYAHQLGYWSKKINKRILHFGRWGRVVNGRLSLLPYEDNWQAALKAYHARRNDPQLGRSDGTVLTDEAPESGALTVAELCNEFRTEKLRVMEDGEIGQRMYDEYVATCDLLVEELRGDAVVAELKPMDFTKLRRVMSAKWGPVRLGNQITRVRSVFKFAYDQDLIQLELKFLSPRNKNGVFKKPTKKVMRLHRKKVGKKLLTADECRTLVKKAPVQLKAMLYLALNCGFGNHDVATLTTDALDLADGWIEYERPKTGIDRRCPLWPETIAALKAALAERAKPKAEEAQGLVFLLPSGLPWLCRGIANPVSVAARKFFKVCGVKERAGIGFYTLRHTFRTVADATLDFPAIHRIMGHADDSIDDVYREHIDDERLVAVVNHVHGWLFAKGGAK